MKSNKKIDFYFFIFSIFILLLLIFPIYSFGNKVEPFLFGLPFSLGWIVICIISQFIGILFFLYIDKDNN